MCRKKINEKKISTWICSKAGKIKAIVFPEPVLATPTILWPAMAIAQPWDWIGVGSVNILVKQSLAEAESISLKLKSNVKKKRDVENNEIN